MIPPSFTPSRPTPKVAGRKISWRLLLGLAALFGAGLLLLLGTKESPSGQPLLSSTGFKERIVQLLGRDTEKRLFFNLGDQQSGTPGTVEADANKEGEPAPEPLATPLSGETILVLINEYRVSKGLNPLVREGRFCEWAYHRANVVSRNWDQRAIVEKQDLVFQAVCPTCKRMGEALSRNINTPEGVLDDWLTSKEIKQHLTAPYNIGCVGTHVQSGINFVALEVGEK